MPDNEAVIEERQDSNFYFHYEGQNTDAALGRA